MGGVFPGAGDLDQFWDNISSARDLTREPPPGRWLLSLADAYDGSGPQPDKVYSKRACFVEDLAVDKTGLDIEDGLLAQLDPMFHLLLQAGGQAWRDAVTGNIDRQRTGIIIGNIALPTDASSALADELLGGAVDDQMFGRRGRTDVVNRLNRYVAGLPAGILGRALGLGGGSYTLDAACASSLYAVKFAMDELQAGRADAMLAGGLSRPESLYTQMGFSSLHAISASGHCAPFDHKADGLVVGEGCGMFLLKRLDDALAAGDRIYALIKGVGLSNDIGGNLMSPDSEGQLRAMRAAYRQAGWQPAAVDLIECHGTGTPVGDVVEFNSLNDLWQDQQKNGKCVIGSVKSNIGHLLTAAGAAGLIKVLLAMHHGQLPPTANFARANPNIDLDNSPFTVLSTAGEWRQRDERTPRRAAVSAFGFGGINAHLLLEQWSDETGRTEPIPVVATQTDVHDIAIIGLDVRFGPWQSLDSFRQRVFGGDPETQPTTLDRWWGVENAAQVRGYAIDRVEVPVGRFRIPPTELGDMLPQQLLMLQIAANAIADAGLATNKPMLDTGVYIGIGLDLNTTNFHVRWSLLDKCRHQVKQLDLDLTDDQFQQWTTDLRDAFCPPLTANRTMGALGGIVASRVARAFNVGGPSFTVSAEETSGLCSLEAGVRALQRHEIETAVVGAVDLASDVRAVQGQAATRPWSASGICRPFDCDADGAVAGDGAAALVLKRLADAQRDGDRIYAVIKGIGKAGGGEPGHTVPPGTAYRRAVAQAAAEAGIATDAIGYIEAHGSGFVDEDRLETTVLSDMFASRTHGVPCAIGSIKADVGHCGAAGGMAGVVRAALALQEHILPPLRHLQQPQPELQDNEAGMFAPRHRQYWLRNKFQGPRYALVNAVGVDGNCSSAVLTEVDAVVSSVAAVPADPDLPTLFSITGDDPNALLLGLDRLAHHIASATSNLQDLAADWYRTGSNDEHRHALSLLAESVPELTGLVDRAHACVKEARSCADGNLFYSPDPMGSDAGIAFVFPGSGNHFHGMGRAAAACWPQVLNRLDNENDYLADQFAAARFWSRGETTMLSHKDVIFGQVWLGTMMSDIVSAFGVRPAAVIGYSLGETAGLFATRAWTDRDLMLQRISASKLFIDELAGACTAARQTWGLPDSESVDWLIGVVDCPATLVREKLQVRERVYLLIINTENESVIGGARAAVMELVGELGCHLHPVSGVTTVHCEVVQPVADAYRDLHLFDTHAPAGIRYYSGILGRAYDLNRDSAAESITGQALHYFDYPRVINSAYADGTRIFIEMGPGATCTRMIDQILGDRKHLARAVCVKGQHEPLQILRLLAQLNTERVPLKLGDMYQAPRAISHTLQDKQTNVVSVPVGKENLKQLQAISHKLQKQQPHKDLKPAEIVQLHEKTKEDGLMQELVEQAARTDTARAEAQAAYLRVANGINQSLAQAWSTQATILQSLPEGATLPPFHIDHVNTAPHQQLPAPVYDRAQCMEFAVGSIARVLGDRFVEADGFPTRVRLPDEPLMLVDRILAVEGEPCSMGPGRVVTEHDVLADDWYLDGGRIPTCIAVESGQADLFLSGYLGIDLQTRGLAMYRLLDAEVTFHAPLPRPGQTICYDIHIDHFFRQGDTWLFRFHFEGTVDEQPLISMRNGCAGFFSRAELDAGRGIVLTSLEKRPMTGKRPGNWSAPVAMEKTSFNDRQIEALRNGDLAGCFGPAFAGLPLHDPVGLPSGRMTLVYRVLQLDPNGGRYGIGSITGEADIHPDDWFLTCHFIDDQVMPGTLMYECCLHTLRIYLLRMGWIGEADEVVYEPLPGISSKLKCRGQVIETTRKVQYEITLKEYGYMPEGTPYVIADALMYADGRPIVQMTDMSLLLSGLHQSHIDELWRKRTVPTRTVLFDQDSILAFATGKPSAAFGDRYRVFDKERVIARLPGPPYQLLDRVVAIENCVQWQLQAGGRIRAEYDVPAEAWYFAANRQADMPFAVLLEIALQPCGWLAAYLGSALTSDTDLSFRNLGGTATRFLPATANTGTIVTEVTITDVARSGGMIIQHFNYDLHCEAGRIYQGNTYFGFFTHEALANQIGLREALPYQPGLAETARGSRFSYPVQAPYPDSMLRMIDRITLFDPDGGPAGLGFISGTAPVDPEAWFFKAHFYQDPVWPGSLGLESFIQLLKVVACHRWGDDGAAFAAMAPGQQHSWVYRGQIIPTDNEVMVQAVIREVDNKEKILRADGFLGVDGRIIYQMTNFTLKLYY